jgi:hypothetical protein
MITPKAGLSVSRQCTLLGIARSSFYYRPQPASSEELDLLARLDRIFTDHPVYGSRRLQVALASEGVAVYNIGAQGIPGCKSRSRARALPWVAGASGG